MSLGTCIDVFRRESTWLIKYHFSAIFRRYQLPNVFIFRLVLRVDLQFTQHSYRVKALDKAKTISILIFKELTLLAFLMLIQFFSLCISLTECNNMCDNIIVTKNNDIFRYRAGKGDEVFRPVPCFKVTACLIIILLLQRFAVKSFGCTFRTLCYFTDFGVN